MEWEIGEHVIMRAPGHNPKYGRIVAIPVRTKYDDPQMVRVLDANGIEWEVAESYLTIIKPSVVRAADGSEAYDFGGCLEESPYPVKFNVGDTVQFIFREKETRGQVMRMDADNLMVRIEDTAWGDGRPVSVTVPKTACILVRKADTREQIDQIAANNSRELEKMIAEHKPAPIVTQAKYFHCVECDGQKVMMGFQTHREMLMHMIVSESDNDRANTLCAMLAEVDGTATDSPTIREASE